MPTNLRKMVVVTILFMFLAVIAPETGATAAAVARGGHSASSPEGLTSTSREAVDAGRAATGHAYIGFRCVSDAPLVL
jgi:hypothetical protein